MSNFFSNIFILETDLIYTYDIYLRKYLSQKCFHWSKYIAANFFLKYYFSFYVISKKIRRIQWMIEKHCNDREMFEWISLSLYSSSNYGIIEINLNIQPRTYNCFKTVRKLTNKNRIKFAAHNNSTVNIHVKNI